MLPLIYHQNLKVIEPAVLKCRLFAESNVWTYMTSAMQRNFEADRNSDSTKNDFSGTKLLLARYLIIPVLEADPTTYRECQNSAN